MKNPIKMLTSPSKRQSKLGPLTPWTTVAGVGLGAGLMYLLDPERGAKRRATARDKAAHVARDQAEGVHRNVEHAKHKAKGVLARMRSMRSDEPIDEVLLARVRARLGHLVANPSSIEVQVEDGEVTLSGPVFHAEMVELLRGVRRVRGVHTVFDQLEPHDSAVGVRGLPNPPRENQGDARSRPEGKGNVLLAGSGIAAAAYALTRSGWIGRALGAAGGAWAVNELRKSMSGRGVTGGVPGGIRDVEGTRPTDVEPPNKGINAHEPELAHDEQQR